MTPSRTATVFGGEPGGSIAVGLNCAIVNGSLPSKDAVPGPKFVWVESIVCVCVGGDDVIRPDLARGQKRASPKLRSPNAATRPRIVHSRMGQIYPMITRPSEIRRFFPRGTFQRQQPVGRRRNFAHPPGQGTHPQSLSIAAQDVPKTSFSITNPRSTIIPTYDPEATHFPPLLIISNTLHRSPTKRLHSTWFSIQPGTPDIIPSFLSILTYPLIVCQCTMPRY